MSIESIEQFIETIIFTADKPVKLKDIQECLVKLEYDLEVDAIKASIESIQNKFEANAFSFELVKTGGGYQFLTKPAYQEVAAAMLHQAAKRRLTNSAMETLSIIAYKQPITKSQIEQIRGVNADYAVNKLMEKELVEIVGRLDEVGKPLLYGTSDFFMDYFGINDLDELPKIKEFETKDNAVGNLPNIDQASDN